MPQSNPAQSGTLHRYSKRLVAFEHLATNASLFKNIILWVGGLGDGLHTVAYPSILAARLPGSWSLAQVQLLSSLSGWGTGSLQRDVKELAQCVDYFRKLKGEGSRIVVMGHSTGCQDAMEYVTGPGHEKRPRIDGVILQAPVSDRDGLEHDIPKEAYEKIVTTAREYVAAGRQNDALPQSVSGTFLGRLPISAYRWLSLLSPDGTGDDDYFSYNLPDERLRKTFGAFPSHTQLLILFSGSDEHVPKRINVKSMLDRWFEAVKNSQGKLSAASGVVAGAHHNLDQDGDEVVEDLVQRVLLFMGALEGSPVTSSL